MNLEDALKLKKETRLRVTSSWVGPEKCSKGRIYVMQEDAKPLWPAMNSFGVSSTKTVPNAVPCNARLPIIDDRGKFVSPTYHKFVSLTYHNFEVVDQTKNLFLTQPTHQNKNS